MLQEFDSVLRPVAFASHTLLPAERNYSVTEKECLAIVFALKKFDMFLDGARFVIQTDHQALSWLQRLQNPAGRLARWALALQRYDYTIQYKKGSTNTVADALSRAPVPTATPADPEEMQLTAAVRATFDDHWGALVNKNDLRAAQQTDGFCRRVIDTLAGHARGDADSDRQFDCYVLGDDGLLLRYIPSPDDDSPYRIVVPRKLRKSFLRYYHDSALAGHSSGQKTYEKLCHTVTWPGMRQDVFRYARSCTVCQKAKPRGGLPFGVMQSVESRGPWQIVACDIMGPFPRSPRGNQYLLVVTDHFTKWVELFPLRTLTSNNVWACLLQVFTRFGFAAQLITDGATYFTSKVFADCCDAMGIRHVRTSVYHPQANITERVNRNLKSMLIAHTARHRDWDLKLPEMAFATRTTVNRSTGFTPAYLNFGRELHFPLDNRIRPLPGGSIPSHAQFAGALRKRLLDATREAREYLDVSRMEQAAQYNKGRRDVHFSVGDLVLKRTHPLSDAARGYTASLANRWDGPYRVTRKSRLSYELEHCTTGAHYGPVHVSELKQFYPADDWPSEVCETPDHNNSPFSSTPPKRRYNLRRQ